VLRASLISLSESRSLRHLAEKSSLGQRISSRFVAGTQVEDALRAAATLNQAGLSVSVDNLGENVSTAEEATHSAQLYLQLLSEIEKRGLNANVSVKLTHMGIDVDPQLGYSNVAGLVEKAASMSPKNFVRVDMEGSAYTQRTLDLVHQLHQQARNRDCVGAVIQSYMRRSEDDVASLLQMRTEKGNLKQSFLCQKTELCRDAAEHHRRVHVTQMIRTKDATRAEIDSVETFHLHPHASDEQQRPRPNPRDPHRRAPRRIEE